MLRGNNIAGGEESTSPMLNYTPNNDNVMDTDVWVLVSGTTETFYVD